MATARPIERGPEPPHRDPEDPIPYGGFKNVKLVAVYELIKGDVRTPYVWIEHVVPARSGKPEDEVDEWDYKAGEPLKPLPEIQVVSIDAAKGEVVFRMPKELDPKDPKFKNYKGTDEDSQLKTVRMRGTWASMPEPTDSKKPREQDPDPKRKSIPITDDDVPETHNIPGTRTWKVSRADLNELRAGDIEQKVRRGVNVSSYNQGGIKGVRINQLKRDSIFYGKGFLRGDVITSIDGKPVVTLAEVVRHFRSKQAARSCVFEIYRNGLRLTLTYHLPK